MAAYFVCTADEAPCSAPNQVLVTEIGVDDFAQIGITPATILTSVTLGFGLVFFFAVMGLVVGSIVRQIRGI